MDLRWRSSPCDSYHPGSPSGDESACCCDKGHGLPYPVAMEKETRYFLVIIVLSLSLSLSPSLPPSPPPTSVHVLPSSSLSHTQQIQHSIRTCKLLTLFSASALMQLPSASRDLLMLAPSLSLAPLLVVTVALSDPARSIKDILARVTCALRPAVRAFWCTNTYDVMVM